MDLLLCLNVMCWAGHFSAKAVVLACFIQNLNGRQNMKNNWQMMYISTISRFDNLLTQFALNDISRRKWNLHIHLQQQGMMRLGLVCSKYKLVRFRIGSECPSVKTITRYSHKEYIEKYIDVHSFAHVLFTGLNRVQCTSKTECLFISLHTVLNAILQPTLSLSTTYSAQKSVRSI